jgi:3-oxoacyl-[acyl-carrier protein] reductase
VIDLKGQIALVTGASRGLGQAITDELGRLGAVVLGTATTTAGVEDIERRLQEQSIAGRGYILDVADPASVAQFGKALEADGHAPGILVNNAGVTRDNLLLRMKDEEWDTVIETNLSSIYRMCKLCLKGMIKARYGRIVNIASVVALSGNPGQSNYCAAKAGMIGFTRALAREVATRGITVNAVAPGFFETDMTQLLTAEQQETLLQHIAMRRLGRPAEVAFAVAFLASPQAGYITGETLNVSGGLHIG